MVMIQKRPLRKIQWMINKTIIQFSPPRSGSTLVYNILRDVFPKRKIKKRHRYESDKLKYPVVVTYRNPLDCIASSIQRYDLTPTNEVIERQIAEFERNGIWDILKIKDNPNVLMLKYEDFFDDFEVIFKGIENLFDIKILPASRSTLTERYQIDAVEKIIKDMDTFDEYNKVTHWHGKHISSQRGRPMYYKHFFKEDQIAYLKSVYKEILLEFNYIQSQ
jgi:hypothetical protein